MDDERAKNIIDTTKNRLARCLNLLEAIHNDLEYLFDQKREWNSEIKYQIGEAAETLGYSLASLERWYDESRGEE